MVMIDSDDLAGPGDLAREHNVTVSSITFWATKDGFPAPLTVLSSGAVYSATAVREWLKENRKPIPPALRQGYRRLRFTDVEHVETDPSTVPTTKSGKPLKRWDVYDREEGAVDSGPYATREEARRHAQGAEQYFRNLAKAKEGSI